MYLVAILFVGTAISWLAFTVALQQPRAEQIAAEAQQQLGVKLKAALAAGGPINALDVCSVEALSLTQSVANTHGVTLRRATLRPRNPYNLADSLEAAVLERMQTQLTATDKIDTVKVDHDGVTSTFIPIRIVEQPCMACHGSVNGTIKAETYQAITDKYPEDKATGYKPGDLRGAWVVTTR